jgi:hypothetical protein
MSEKKGVLYYYTCPSQARLYYDAPSIIDHYKGVLSEIPAKKEWIWIFDSAGFTFEHAIQTTVAIELAKLLSTFNNLKKIIIINPTMYITATYHIVSPFLRRSVEMNHDFTCAEDLVFQLQ